MNDDRVSEVAIAQREVELAQAALVASRARLKKAKERAFMPLRHRGRKKKEANG